MKHPHIFLFVLFVLSLAVCRQSKAQNHLLDEGISWQLAEQRKADISQLTYTLSFSIPENKTEGIEGEELLSFRLRNATDVILDFNESGDKVKSVELVAVKGKKGGEKRQAISWSFINGHIVIGKKYTRKGENRFCIRFTAGSQGLNRRDSYLYTLFVPDRAHTVFPCFDQPNLKATFNLNLQIPDKWIAASNGLESTGIPDLSEISGWKGEAEKAGYKWIRFNMPADTPIPTYLFAFAVGEFEHMDWDEDGYSIGAYYRETDEARIRQLPDILHQVVFSLKWQEEFTGVKYPFPKYDIVVLPGFQFGGMEHVGATFYNDNTLFLPPNPTSDEELKRTELISHETSHMWFGDAVTMNWFDDVWTKEVFANYFAAEITAPLFPQLDHELNWLRTYQGAAISQDRTEGRTSIRQPLDNMRYAGLIYNNIIYNKAPVMMRKMVDLMGKEAYRRGIRKYVEKYKYGNATWDDLIEILDAETDVDLKAFSKEWVDTAHWPTRHARSFADAYDTGYYGYTELTALQIDSLMSNYPESNGAQSMAAMMTLYENYLNKTIGASRFFDIMIGMTRSDNPLTCLTAISYMGEPLREMQLTLDRHDVESKECEILELSRSHQLHEVRTQSLRLLISRSISDQLTDTLYSIWKANNSPLLSIYDYMTLSYELSVRLPDKARDIIAQQRTRITNPDRLAQFDYIARAVSPSEAERDELFSSLSKPENRRIEPWTLSVIYYLNHPLRDRESVKYIRPSLELLPDIQRTGDIFFPGNWCSSLLSGHRSPEAYHVVESYLTTHADMMQLLRNKILQAEYYLKRMNK